MSAALTLEKTELKLGFIALLDCAPLVVAREKGFFNQQGLDVILCKEASWASIRDKVSFGLYDGAHMLAPMPLAATLGLNGNRTPMQTALALSQGGNAITLSQELYLALSSAISDWNDSEQIGDCFRSLIREHDRKPILATVYPYSNHHYQLCYWLEQYQIDIQKDVQLIAAPPTKMLENLRSGMIDGYCVGEPWNSLALLEQIGGIITTGHQIWGGRMEKVLGVTQAWAEQHPNTYQALIQALLQACAWAEAPENRQELNHLLSLPPYLDQAAEKLANFTSPYSMEQHYAGGDVNRPSPEQGYFLLQQMHKCGQISAEPDSLSELCQQVYRADLYQRWSAGN